MRGLLFRNDHSNALVKVARPRVPTGFKAVVTNEASDPYWETIWFKLLMQKSFQTNLDSLLDRLVGLNFLVKEMLTCLSQHLLFI
jgi:hypothetical protein